MYFLFKDYGEKFVQCSSCNHNIHKRCRLDNFGCKNCRDEMFPASCDIFFSGENNLLFDPYNPDSLNNCIGTDDDIDAESDFMNALSKNLRKCKYTFASNLAQSNSKEFSILSLNIGSLKTNFDKLINEIDNLQKFDAICLCETGLDPEETTLGNNHNLYTLPGFNSPIFQKPARVSNRGGGLAIYINSRKFNDDSAKILDNISTAISPEIGEFLFVEVDTGPKNKNIIIGNFYRSPSFKPDCFTEKLSEIIQILDKDSNKNILLMGDANIDLIQHDTNAHVQNYFNVVSQNGYIPTISRPTRITEHSMTLIDHIFSNSMSNFMKSGILTDPFADHLGVFIKISLSNTLTHTNSNNGRYFYTEISETTNENFVRSINNADWQHVFDTVDANAKYNKFLEIYENCYNSAFPKVSKKIQNKRSTGKPWIMKWLQEACDRKNKLYDIFIKHPTIENKEAYKKYKKWTETQVYKAKRKYYNNQIFKFNSNAKKQWKTMNEIINRRKAKSSITKLKFGDQNITNTTKICNLFNSYFCNIASKLKKDIIPQSHDKEIVDPLNFLKKCNCISDCTCSQSSMFVEPCNETEVSTIIKDLSNSSSSDFSTLALKLVKNNISPILVNTINASLVQGIFPTSLKVAKVIPIFKSGKRNDVSNYRPISLLSVFSKIYEKIMYKRVVSFLNKNKTIYNRQYGFRARHSCEHALLDAQHKLTCTLDRKETALLLLIDFSKAFDMVDHSLILRKLSFYGIRGIAHDWFRSYLANRHQYVSVNGGNSEIDKLEHGVPQGSILGPLLFIIFINDLPNIFADVHFILYADDANIIITGTTIKELENKINALIPKLTSWVGVNSLKLNTTKTKYMVISNTIKHDFDIVIHNQTIARVKQDRFLGVIIDEKLTFNAHKTALARKISNNCGVLYRARYVLNQKSLVCLYYSFIQSHMIYCSNVWGLGTKRSLNSIFISQKRAIRAMSFTKLYKKDKITGVYTYGHTKMKFAKYEFLSIHNLVLTQALNLMQKIKLGIAPESIIQLFEINTDPYSITDISLYDHQIRRLNRLNINNNNVIKRSVDTINFFVRQQAGLKYVKTLLRL